MPEESAYGEKHQPFIGITTFMRCQATRNLENVDVAILGIPFDSGTSYRSGSRFGPRKIREASLAIWGFNPYLMVKPLDILKVVDYGDVAVVPPSIINTIEVIRDTASSILSRGGVKIVSLGGDHSITFPLLGTYFEHYGPISVIHFDSHPDTWSCEFDNQPYSHGTPFRRAIIEGYIKPNGYIQVGIRGPVSSVYDLKMSVKLGASVITTKDIYDRGVNSITDEIRNLIKGPVYLSLDIDVLDPAYAPGTGTPEVGGLTSYQLLELIRQLKGLDLVGFDIVEVNPSFDHGEITSIMAANLTFEFLSLLAIIK